MRNTVGLIAMKVGMSRMVDEKGLLTPVTLLQATEQSITKQLNGDRDGYTAVQVGYFEKSEKNLTKADIARLRKESIAKNFTRFQEFRVDDASAEGLEIGTVRSVDLFSEVSSVDVTGFVKGRGFQGATKRFNSKTGRRTHGSHFHRRPGSLGCRTTPGRVMKNKKQPGHMGTNKVTVMNLQVLDVDKDTNTIAIKGSVPGTRNGFLVLRASLKIKTKKEGKK